jgi:hypothetical protein
MIFFFLTCYGFAQSDFRDGYIINNSNDTLFGLIDYRGNRSNAKKCIFIKSNDTEHKKIEYSPYDIKAYRFINSKYYVSKQINVNEKDELIFLEFLIKGIANIFYYRDESGKENYYIEKGNGNLVLLKNDNIVSYIENNESTRESKQYIGVLNYFFQDMPNICKETEKIDLDHESLIKIARDYHNAVCKNEACVVYEKKVPKVSIVIGPLIGINYSTLHVKETLLNEFYYLNGSKLNSVNLSIGLFLKASMPSINERLFFQYEINYNRATFTTNNTFAYFMNYINSITITFNSINNGGMIRYEFPKGKVRPVFECGGFYNYFYKTDFSRKLDVKWGTNITHQSFTDNPFIKYDFGVSIGIGCIYKFYKDKSLFIDLKYQRGFGLYINNTSLEVGIPF